MTWLPWVLLLVCAAALVWLAWRHLVLRRRLDAYALQVRRAAEGKLPVSALPVDVAGLEDISNSVAALDSAFNFQLSTLDAERAKLAAVLEQMADAVLIADPHGRIQFANPAAQAFIHGDPIGRSITEILRHHQLIQAWQRSQETGEMQIEATELLSSRQFVQVVVMPDRHTPGGSLLLVQDLTRLRRLETVRRDFVSNLSHELRTPLASLKALTETLQEGALDDPPAARRFLEQMLVEVDALAQMASELLELSRIESGKLVLDLEPVRPCELLDSASSRMQMQAERANLVLQIDCASSLPLIRGDFRRLEQVLVSLVHNAIKFTPAGGQVWLLASEMDRMLHFSVRDTGIGIPEEDLSRIFERFYKSDRSRSGGGTGLGLSIARHLVESHGGSLWAESRQGQGSTFHFTVPLA